MLKKILFWALFFAGFSAQALTMVKSCNNCSDVKARAMAETVRSNGAYVIVLDSVTSTVKAYRIRKSYADDNIEVFNASAVTVPDSVKATFKQSMDYKNSYIAEIKKQFGYSELNYEMIKSQGSSSRVYATSADASSEDDTNAYDFMSDSSLRRVTYDLLTYLNSNYERFQAKFNDTVEDISIQFGGEKVSISVDLQLLSFEPKLIFTDGSYVVVQFNTSTSTFDVISGVDEAGNDIPHESTSKIGGKYTIKNQQHLDDLKEYMSYYWLISFRGIITSGTPAQSCTTTCRVISEARYECTAQCK